MVYLIVCILFEDFVDIAKDQILSWIKSIKKSKLDIIESFVLFVTNVAMVYFIVCILFEDFVAIATDQILSWIKSIKNSKLDIIESFVILCYKCSNGILMYQKFHFSDFYHSMALAPIMISLATFLALISKWKGKSINIFCLLTYLL